LPSVCQIEVPGRIQALLTEWWFPSVLILNYIILVLKIEIFNRLDICWIKKYTYAARTKLFWSSACRNNYNYLGYTENNTCFSRLLCVSEQIVKTKKFLKTLMFVVWCHSRDINYEYAFQMDLMHIMKKTKNCWNNW